MKHAVLIGMILALIGCGAAQTYLTLPEDQHSMVRVQSVDMKKEILYSSLQQWFASNLGKSNEALQIQDKDAGLLVGRMLVPAGVADVFGLRHDLQMDIKVEVKEGKYRITMDNFTFYYQGPGRLVMPGPEHQSSLATANEIADSIYEHVISLKENSEF